MSEAEPISTLVQRLRDGDPEAAGLVFDRYARRLARAAEQHLTRKLAGRLDGEDVVQSVFRTFFRRHAAGEFRLDTSAQLWRLLLQITLRKARFQARFHLASRRDAAAEAAGNDDIAFAEALAHEPGPAEAAALVDQIDSLLLGLPELHARVLDKRLQGYTVAEIAEQLAVSRQTVYRVLDLLQQRLTRQDQE
jgi:RNA polymerase sigma-70 factor (ECF subfamily)